MWASEKFSGTEMNFVRASDSRETTSRNTEVAPPLLEEMRQLSSALAGSNFHTSCKQLGYCASYVSHASKYTFKSIKR